MEFEQVPSLVGSEMCIRDRLLDSLNKMETKLSDANNLKKELDTIIAFFEKVIDLNTKSTRQFIENLVNEGIAFVIGNNSITISIESSIKNNKVQYKININDNDNSINGGSESFGGGILAIISFIFRVIMIHMDKMYPLIVIDENLTFVSVHYQNRMSQFIKNISDQFNINILMISHQEMLNTHADKIYEMKKDKSGIARLYEITDNKD